MTKSIVIAVFTVTVFWFGYSAISSIETAVAKRDAAFDQILGAK